MKDWKIKASGIPKYIELISQENSLYQAIQKLAFTPQGYFVDEYRRIFTSHFGKNQDFRKLIEVLATHPYGLNRMQISNKTKIELGGGLSQQLYDLETCGFVESYVPFDKEKNSKQIIYCLKDHYLRFYFSFIHPNLKKIKSGIDDIFYRISQTSAYYAWLGRSFEYVCRDHAKKISHILGFSGIDYSFGPYFQAKGESQGIQIDLVFDRADHVLTVCEMKYTQSPPGLEVAKSTERKVALLTSKKTIQKVLITKTPPSRELLNAGYFFKIISADQLLG